MLFHRLMQKYELFEAYREDRTQKHTVCAVKNPKFLSLITHQKNSRRPKVWNMIDRDPVVVFMQKSDEFDQ